MTFNFEGLVEEYQHRQRDLTRAQLDALQKFQDDFNFMIEEEKGRLHRLIDEHPSTEPKLPGDGTFTARLTAAVYEMLLEESPLHRQVIYDRLKDQGIHVGGKDGLGNLSAYLSNDDRFITAGRGEWTLPQAVRPMVHVLEEQKREINETLRQQAVAGDGKISFTHIARSLNDTATEQSWNAQAMGLAIHEVRNWLMKNGEWQYEQPETLRLRISEDELAPVEALSIIAPRSG